MILNNSKGITNDFTNWGDKIKLRIGKFIKLIHKNMILFKRLQQNHLKCILNLTVTDYVLD